MRCLSHAQYYQDRSSEYELCNDFPADEILIEGLHIMQSHFRANHVAIDIPVVRVMNAAHFIASYMFNTECSGDQLEYDVLAHESIGRDKQLVPLTMIVVAAMLKRTDGFRARQCRNLILDNRDPDFEEGVTLYDRFLQSSEKHFAEEDFLIDTHSQIIQLQEENEKLAAENLQLKYTISTMEKDKPQSLFLNLGNYYDNSQDHSRHVTVTVPAGTDVSALVRSFFAEDVTAEEVAKQEEQPVSKTALPFFVPERLAELGTYTIAEFEALYHDAVKGGAPKLAQFLKHYRELKVFDTKGLNIKDTYEKLKAYFGDELDFGYTNFSIYYR